MKTLFDSLEEDTCNPRFDDFVQSVQHCDLCPRLCCRNKILSKANGNIESKVLFVAEAPGRLGADKTGVPLYGDRTGNNFDSFLGSIGWHREDLFITNAVLCNPQNENGNNGTPTLEEIDNCSIYLEMTISLVNPEVIIPLGQTALTALNLISRHDIQLSRDVAQPKPWLDRIVFPLYHPGPRALVHRSQITQHSDYILLKKFVNPTTGIKIKKPKKVRAKSEKITKDYGHIQEVACAILSLFPRGKWISQFQLSKLLYLFDLRAKQRLGRTFASSVYLRKENGPWGPDIYDAVEELCDREISKKYRAKRFYYCTGPSPKEIICLSDEVMSIIREVFEVYGNKSDSELSTSVYLTRPMKYLLKREKNGEDISRIPVLYEDKEAQEMDD